MWGALVMQGWAWGSWEEALRRWGGSGPAPSTGAGSVLRAEAEGANTEAPDRCVGVLLCDGISVCVHVSVCACVCLCMHAYGMHVCVSLCVHVCALYVSVRTCVHVCVCMHVCASACV